MRPSDGSIPARDQGTNSNTNNANYVHNVPSDSSNSAPSLQSIRVNSSNNGSYTSTVPSGSSNSVPGFLLQPSMLNDASEDASDSLRPSLASRSSNASPSVFLRVNSTSTVHDGANSNNTDNVGASIPPPMVQVLPSLDLNSEAVKKWDARLTSRQNADKLARAIKSNDPQLVKSLLEKGFDPNVVDAEWYTALTLSLSECRKFKDIIDVLLDWKLINVNQIQIDANGNSALNLAVEQNNLPIVQKILTRGYINWTRTMPSAILKAIRLNKPNLLLPMLVAINPEDKGLFFWRLQLIQRILLVTIYQTTTSAIGRFDAPNILKKYFVDHFEDNAEGIIDQILHTIGLQGRNLFTLAVEMNFRGIINYLLSLKEVCPSIINEKDARNELPLSIALSNDNLQLAELLLQNCADPNSKLCEKLLLNVLIKRNYMDGIKLLIAHGADVNMPEPGGHTPLTQAVKCNNLDVINYLLDKGADVNLTNGKRYKPLTISVRYSNQNVASLLLDNGAEVDMCDGLGKTPLTFAIEQENPVLVNVLLANGATINCADELGYTPLTIAIKINSWEMVEMLKKRGADVNLEDSNGHTPITFAIALNLEQISVDLINEGQVDVNSQGWFGSTALLNAIAHKNEHLVQLLLSEGADVGLVDWKGRRPMVEAVKADCLPILKALTSAERTEDDDGSDISFDWLDFEAKPQTPLSQAIALNNYEAVGILLQHHAHTKNSGLQFETLNEAIDNNNLSAMELLLENGVNIAAYYQGQTPLERVIQNDNPKLIDCIIINGGIKPETLLTLAIAKCSLKIISQCVDIWGFDINSIAEDGSTPLTKSIECNNSTVDFLIAKDADVNQIDGHGFTPLTKALEINQLKIIKLLIDKGADVSKVDGKNVKPLSKAVDTNDQQIINYIFSHYANNKGSADENPSCRICYETFEKVPAYSTKCGHLFCKICMERLKSTSSQCPVCRSNIYYNAMHPVFF